MVHSPDEQLLHDVADAAPSVLTSHRRGRKARLEF